ncbi:hypothetical protein AMELA_G00009160 [Ameiurus melas]|uniref:Uncharacterized protein n=1 Tax=Ameiurus melas TaxID=219545 RepID=A0A7J6BGR1_AMEME|nr:hypothetical protein AMELA_G00009160 [Ameiurus melas]
MFHFRALKKLVNEQQNDSDVYQDAALFSLRSNLHTSKEHSPFLQYVWERGGVPAEVPAEMLVTDAYLHLVTEKQQMKFLIMEIRLCPVNVGTRWIHVFAEQDLLRGTISNVQTSSEAFSSARRKIACTLLSCGCEA